MYLGKIFDNKIYTSLITLFWLKKVSEVIGINIKGTLNNSICNMTTLCVFYRLEFECQLICQYKCHHLKAKAFSIIIAMLGKYNEVFNFL